MKIPTFNEYGELCNRTVAPGKGGRDDNDDLIHGVLGASSEVGELADQLKRFMYYGKPLDLVNLKEEVGDVMWYLALIAKSSGFTLQDCAEANIRKLAVRYPGVFPSAFGADRDLAAEQAALKGDASAVGA